MGLRLSYGIPSAILETGRSQLVECLNSSVKPSRGES